MKRYIKRPPAVSHSTDEKRTDKRNQSLPESETPTFTDIERIIAQPNVANADAILRLQQTIGNQAVMRMLDQAAANLQSVSPQTIQRQPNDNDGGNDESGGNDGGATTNPEDAVEVDGNDSEIQEQNQEIDEALNEAKQVPTLINAQMVSDDAAVETITREDSEDDMMGVIEDGDSPVAPSNIAVSTVDDDDNDPADFSGATKIVSGGLITGKAPVKQKTGTSYKGRHFSAQPAGPAAVEGGVNAARVADTGVDAVTAYDAIKSAVSLKDTLSTADATSDAGAEGVSGVLGKVATFFDVPPMNIILPVVTVIGRIHLAIVKFKQMRAFKALMKGAGGDKKTGKKRSTPLQDAAAIGGYGFAKTKRGFWTRVIRAAINVGQLLARLITVLTGGTAALISEAVGASMALSQGVIKIGQSLKGIYKLIRGRRGKRRLEAANTIVDHALDGDQDMLQLLVDGEPFGKIWWFSQYQTYQNEAEVSQDQERLKILKRLATKPKNTAEMLEYLQTAEKENMIVKVKTHVTIMLKSN